MIRLLIKLLIGPLSLLAGASVFWAQNGYTGFDRHGLLLALTVYALGVFFLLAVPATRRRVLSRH